MRVLNITCPNTITSHSPLLKTTPSSMGECILHKFFVHSSYNYLLQVLGLDCPVTGMTQITYSGNCKSTCKILQKSTKHEFLGFILESGYVLNVQKVQEMCMIGMQLFCGEKTREEDKKKTSSGWKLWKLPESVDRPWVAWRDSHLGSWYPGRKLLLDMVSLQAKKQRNFIPEESTDSPFSRNS